VRGITFGRECSDVGSRKNVKIVKSLGRKSLIRRKAATAAAIALVPVAFVINVANGGLEAELVHGRSGHYQLTASAQREQDQRRQRALA
jgi:hypothetical protein